jgi:hypothetical protein
VVYFFSPAKLVSKAPSDSSVGAGLHTMYPAVVPSESPSPIPGARISAPNSGAVQGGTGGNGGGGNAINGNGNVGGNQINNNYITEPKLENPTFHEQSSELPVIEFGKNGTFFAGNGKGAIDVNGYEPVKLSVRNGVIYLNASLWNASGESPVQITNNNFMVRPLNWDKNSSQNALEVVNEKQQPILQFIKLSPSHYLVEGLFPTPGKLLLLAGDNGMHLISMGSPLPSDFQLTPIFKYPSWKYPGKYADG